MIYFIVFGDCAASITKLTCYPDTENFLTSKICYILILAGVMVFPLLQKELKEIKAVSITLFVAIGLFLGLMVVELEVDGSDLNPDDNYNDYYKVKLDLALMSGLGIVLCAYGFIQNLFPIYLSLENKSTANSLKATGIGLGMSFLLYVGMAILSLYVFGSSV